MQTVHIHDVKTKLPTLIEHALAGEEVVIARAGKSLVKLQALQQAKPARQLGAARHILTSISEDFADDQSM